MKMVNLLAVVVMLLGIGYANNASANLNGPIGNENSISAQFDLDGGIVDPDDNEDDEDSDHIGKKR
jgi:hypothetical protein